MVNESRGQTSESVRGVIITRNVWDHPGPAGGGKEESVNDILVACGNYKSTIQ